LSSLWQRRLWGYLIATLLPTGKSSRDRPRCFTEIPAERRENEHKLKQQKFLLDVRSKEDGKEE